MPHKRAKFSVRQREHEKHGTDLPPTGGVPLARESIPKSMAWVLQAEGVRKRYKEKRARLEGSFRAGTKEREHKLRKTYGRLQHTSEIKHGESLGQYNRRVEEEMRIPVAEAMQASRSTSKRAVKSDKALYTATLETSKLKPANSPEVSILDLPAASLAARKTEFAKRPATTRLNDIVQAPPNLTTLPRGVAKRKAHGGSTILSHKEGVVSMVQRQQMEDEREKAIKRYRELKELKAPA